MKQEIERLEGQLPLPIDENDAPTNAMLEWYRESGRAVVDLGRMLRKPTGSRPFVYEVRFDLLSMRQSVASIVVKGFGEDGGLIAFHDCVGFVDGVRSFEARLRAGKVKWSADLYPPANYAERVAAYQSGTVYRLG